jgi:hypothetical protein
MEALGVGWLAEIAKQGLGYLLFGMSLLVIWWQNRLLMEYGHKVTEALTRMGILTEQVLTVQRERVAAEKETASTMNLLVTKIEGYGALGTERASRIISAIEGRGNERSSP